MYGFRCTLGTVVASRAFVGVRVFHGRRRFGSRATVETRTAEQVGIDHSATWAVVAGDAVETLRLPSQRGPVVVGTGRTGVFSG